MNPVRIKLPWPGIGQLSRFYNTTRPTKPGIPKLSAKQRHSGSPKEREFILEPGREISSTEFWRFAQFAGEEKLEYLVIGGMALNFHKILRQAINSDIWIHPKQANFPKLKSVLIKLDYAPDELPFLDALS